MKHHPTTENWISSYDTISILSCSDLGAGAQYGCRSRGQVLHDLNSRFTDMGVETIRSPEPEVKNLVDRDPIKNIRQNISQISKNWVIWDIMWRTCKYNEEKILIKRIILEDGIGIKDWHRNLNIKVLHFLQFHPSFYLA